MKHHNNLTDDQIHVPKGFSGANNRSLPIKNAAGNLEWEKCNYTTSLLVTCVADVGGNLHNRYFTLYSSNDAAKYAVYLQITDTVVMYTPSGYDGVIAANVSATGDGSTAINIGDAIQVAIDAHADFTATDDGAGAVTITGITTATNASDYDTNFVFTSTQTKSTSEILTTDSSGNIAWNSQTNILSDHIIFQGHGTITTDYHVLNNFSSATDGKFGIDLGVSVTSGGLTSQYAVRSSRFIASRKYYMNRWTGVLTNSNTDVLTLALWKVTPVNSGSSILPITVLKETTVTGLGNATACTFDLDLTGEANREITRGDVVLCAIKNDDASGTVYLNSSVNLEYKT
jgi:hypothetical protein